MVTGTCLRPLPSLGDVLPFPACVPGHCLPRKKPPREFAKNAPKRQLDLAIRQRFSPSDPSAEWPSDLSRVVTSLPAPTEPVPAPYPEAPWPHNPSHCF